jgi:RNA recognition motif-containing protein
METKKLFIGWLSWSSDWQEIKDAFKQYWEITFVKIIKDKETGKSKGFWFIEFANLEEAKKAKEAMNWTQLGWRNIKVDYAQEKFDNND